MPNTRQFTIFSNQIESLVSRLADQCSENDWSALVAALAFHLDCVLSAAPDDFWVMPVVDRLNVTDAELDRENEWNAHLDHLFRDYVVHL